MKTALHLHDTLLDDECSLYTCRLPIKITSEFSPRCFNPVAKLLQEGDDMVIQTFNPSVNETLWWLIQHFCGFIL